MIMMLTNTELNYLSLFEKTTGVLPKDCICLGDTVAFVVSKPELGKAIGKGGECVLKLKEYTKRPVFVIADGVTLEEFLHNIFHNINILNIELRESPGERVVFLTISENDRGIAIGRNGERVKIARALVGRKFSCGLILKTRRVL